MSEGSRNDRPAGDGSDDFYATVSTSAGASRSTRVRQPDPNPSSGTPNGALSPSKGSDANGAPNPASGSPSPSKGSDGNGAANPTNGALSTSTGSAQRPSKGDDLTNADQPAAKSWRDRWNSLTTSVTGKQPAVGADGEPQRAARGKKPSPYEVAQARLHEGSGAQPGPQRGAPAGLQSGAQSHGQPDGGATATIPAAAVASSAAAANRSADPAPAEPARGEPARGAETLSTTEPKAKVGTPRRTRKARLRLSRLDPWSVMKTAFLFSIAAGIVMVVAVYVVWTVIGSSGLFASINDIVGSVVSTPGDTTPFRVEEYVNTQKVMGVTAFLACIDVVIFTALATLASFLYNLAATMLGGLEVTLAED